MIQWHVWTVSVGVVSRQENRSVCNTTENHVTLQYLLKNGGFLLKPVDSAKTFFWYFRKYWSDLHGGLKFEADTPGKWNQHVHFSDFQAKILNVSVARQWLLNQILVWQLHTMGMLLSFLGGICFKPHASLTSINVNINESLTCIERFFFNGISHCCCFEVTWFSAWCNVTVNVFI